jgi:hypothetical protein
VRGLTAWLAGAAGAAAAAYRRLRGREPAEDPRAEELRRRLDEARAVVEEQHEEVASPETPVDAVMAPQPESEPEPEAVEDRRRAVHERARAAAEEMRGNGPAE